MEPIIVSANLSSNQDNTVPPVLRVWDHRLVVDTETVLISGMAQNSAGVVVTVSAGGWSTDAALSADGAWRAAVPLAVGVNEIIVKARDGAGLTTAWTGTVIRLITDRTLVDLAQAKDLLRRIPAGEATAEELERYNRGELRGTYDFADLNRVNSAVELVHGSLKAQGYLLDVQAGSDSLREPSQLPSGYSLLEYIESSGTQYIDSKFKANQNTRVVLDFQLTTLDGGWHGLVSARDGSAESYGNNFSLWVTNDNQYRTDFGPDGGVMFGVVDKNRHIADKNRATTTIDSFCAENPKTTFSGSYSLKLFTGFSGGTPEYQASMRCYSCKIYDDGSLARDFVPCKNLSGAVGLFDLVNSQFYGNGGTGSFTAGPVVARAVDLAKVTELEYIESSGTQYIDTQFMHNQNTRLVMDAQVVARPSGHAWLFEGRISYTSAAKGLFLNQGQTWNADYKDSSTRAILSNIGPLDRLRIDFNKNTLVVNEFEKTWTAGNFQSTVPLVLLACNTNGVVSGGISAKLYSCKIYDDGILVRDYMAAKLTDGTVGLYDKLSGFLYINAGTGSFSAGPEISQGPPVLSNFDEADAPVEFILQRYLKNVSSILGVRLVNTSVTLPLTMDNLSIRDANSLEQALVAVDEVTPIIRKSFIYAGEAMAGEF